MRSSKPARKYSLRSKILALIISPISFLVLVELVLQVAGCDPRPRAVFQETGEHGIYRQSPRYFWTLLPNAHIFAPMAGFDHATSNSLGLRGPEIPKRVSPDEIRILCLGDSITFGLGLRDRDAWPAVTERFLREKSGRPVVVVNGGVPGWSSVQGYRLYRDLVSRYDFDFVVFYFGMNDAKHATGGIPDRYYRTTAGPVPGDHEFLPWSRVGRLVRSMVAEIEARTGERTSRRVSAREFRAQVTALVEAAKHGGPQPVFIRCPQRIGDTTHEFRGILDKARALGVKRVVGPVSLLNPVAPYNDGICPPGRRVESKEGPFVLFGRSTANLGTMSIGDVAKIVSMLSVWKATVERYQSLLPEGSLTRSDLFGSAPADRIFRDNCHLSRWGALQAGESIAREILRRIRH